MMKYRVSYTTTRPNYSPATVTVLVGGETTFADIPKICAIRRGLKVEEITIVAAVLDPAV